MRDWFYQRENRHVFATTVKFFIDDKLSGIHNRVIEKYDKEKDRNESWRRCLKKIQQTVTQSDYKDEIVNLKNRIGNAGDLDTHFKTTFMEYLKKIIPAKQKVHCKLAKAEEFLQDLMSTIISNRRVQSREYFKMGYNEQERFLVDLLRLTFSNLSKKCIVKVSRSIVSRNTTTKRSSFDTVMESIHEEDGSKVDDISPRSSVSNAKSIRSSNKRKKDKKDVHSFTVKSSTSAVKKQPKINNINININPQKAKSDEEKVDEEDTIEIVNDDDYETKLDSVVGGGNSVSLRSFTSQS